MLQCILCRSSLIEKKTYSRGIRFKIIKTLIILGKFHEVHSNIRIPHWNRTMSMFLKLYVIAVYKGFKAAWFGWLNNSYAIYGDCI